ncbi:MAG: aldehyde dehydrogenase family protein [Bacteriovoracaceae bacterium]|nr:aldehyde dehydrogenase family protein [Bacteriovoracaceae bacterium]
MEAIQQKYHELTQGHLDKKNHSYESRVDHLIALRKLILENENMILEALNKDLGKSRFEGVISETLFLVKEIDHTLKKLKKWMKKKRVSTPFLQFPARSYIIPEPIGVVLIISPWNYPFQLLISPLIGALAAGNMAILKPSEVAPNVSSVVARLIPKYLSKSIVSVVEGAVAETQALLDLPFNHIFYTGNSHVGRIVMEKAAKHLCPVTLELGGKSPCFVDKNNDLDLVAKRLLWGKFFNTGQTCVAPDYVLVEEEVRSPLIEAMKAVLKDFYPMGAKESPDYGKVINKRHFLRLESYLSEDEIVIGGERDIESLYFSPTILEASEDSLSMKEEIFGPILPILAVKNFDDALTFINQRAHPLAAYAFSKDNELLNRFREEVTAGGMCLNDSLVHLTNEGLPFGGVGESGMGSYHGKKSFDIFTHYKSVMKRGLLIDLPVRYPPYAAKESLIRRLLNWLG